MTIVSLPLERLNPATLLAFFNGCKISDDSINCRLDNALTVLHVLGAVLAVILLVVVLFAVRAWQSSKTLGEFPPERRRKAGRR